MTLPNGDVSIVAGSEFWVKDYQKMQDTIMKYAVDKEFYREMSGVAKKRAEKLLDSEHGFGDVMQEILSQKI